MKKISIISILIGCMTLGMVTTSCEDMLRPDSTRHSYIPAQDTLYSYMGIVKSLQNVAERYIVLGECRGELVSGTSYVSDTISAILNFDMAQAVDGSNRFLRASDYYHIINSCNAYLAFCDTSRTTGTLQPYMMKEASQVEAIRAWVYLQLIQVYGEVPFYTEPLLTTDAIEAFASDKNQPKANADNLADLLAPSLEKALQVELLYGQPQYNMYQDVCHSSKTMIPLNLILGDLYLTKGDKASCTIAAQYYYDYLSNNQGMGKMVPGGPLPYCFSYGFKADGMDNVAYRRIGSIPWNETEATTIFSEAITAIPSSTNKLWGTVLRGVNELYGYNSEISVHTENTSDSTSQTNASVLLTPRYNVKQLAASEAYFKLCKEQPFEVLIGPNVSDMSQLILTTDTVVGDARQVWVRDVDQTYPNGMRDTEKFISKLNPSGFSTVGHNIYRKSMVWLRYAEALNGAGYPSYAFAILKNGLCSNDKWLPDPNGGNNGIYDYAVKDSAWYFVKAAGDTIYCDDDKALFATKADLENYLSGTLTEEDSLSGVWNYDALSLENYTDESSNAYLYYIDRRETLRSPSFLNFNFNSLDGTLTSEYYFRRTSLLADHVTIEPLSVQTGEDPVTVGVHSRGCGNIPLDKNRESQYDYVKQVAKKAKAYGYDALTKEDIYSGNFDDVVQKCVEDLIVDEEAMELAFEGTRFFDLMRVAHRRNDPDYLASRVARRDASLRGKLSNQANWYFPLPGR